MPEETGLSGVPADACAAAQKAVGYICKSSGGPWCPPSLQNAHFPTHGKGYQFMPKMKVVLMLEKEHTQPSSTVLTFIFD